MKAVTEPGDPQSEQGSGPPVASPRGSFTPPAHPSRVWIWDTWRDLLLLLLAPLWIAAVVFALQRRFAVASLFLLVVTFLAVGHHLPGFVRVYGHREVARRYRARLFLAPLVLFAVSLTCVYLDLAGLTAVLLLWGLWHAMSQAYGIMRIYDCKVYSFALRTICLDFLICFCWFGAGILFSAGRLEQLLNVLYACGVPLVSPVIVQALQLLWGGLTFAVTAAFLVNYITQRRQGQHASLVKLVAMASSISFWWFAMVNVGDVLLGLLLYEVFHAIQSLAIVRAAAVRTVERGGQFAPWAEVFCRRGLAAGLLMFGLAMLYGLPFYLTKATPFGIADAAATGLLHRVVYALVAASTMWHFYVEGFTWRLREAWVRSGLDVPESPVAAGRLWSILTSVPHAAKWALLIAPLALLGGTQWRLGQTVDGVPANLAEVIPQSWKTRAQFGAWLLDQGRANDAVKELNEALKIQPHSTQALCDLGRALCMLGRFDEAVEQFQLAVEQEPDFVAARTQLGRTLFSIGNLEDGTRQLQIAVDLNPQDANVHFDLGVARAQLGLFDEALASFNRAIALNGSFALAYNGRGTVYLNKSQLEDAPGNSDKAVADFDKAIEIDPTLTKAYRNRADLSVTKNDLPKAIADYSAAIATEGVSWSDYVRRGYLYYNLKQYDKARDDYLESHRRENRRLDPLERLVELFTSCPDESYRDPEQAIQWSRRACQQSNWRNPRALVLLAASYAAAGDFDQAISWQEQALQIIPPDASEQIKESLRKRVEQYKEAKSKLPPAPSATQESQVPAAPKEPGTSDDGRKEPAGT
jgi:tetratricopeptide (TPR) repeat protein